MNIHRCLLADDEGEQGTSIVIKNFDYSFFCVLFMVLILIAAKSQSSEKDIVNVHGRDII
jgi:hypothetical protein